MDLYTLATRLGCALGAGLNGAGLADSRISISLFTSSIVIPVRAWSLATIVQPRWVANVVICKRWYSILSSRVMAAVAMQRITLESAIGADRLETGTTEGLNSTPKKPVSQKHAKATAWS